MQEIPRKKAIKASTHPNERLKREREKRGWTRDYVADQIGSDTQAIGRWERGAIAPSPYYRQKLCEQFGMDAAELGFFKEEVKDSPERYSTQEVKDSLDRHPTQEETPPADEVSRIAAGTKPEVVEKSSSPQVFSGYRGLLALITLGGVSVLIAGLLLTLFSWWLLTSPLFISSTARSTPFSSSQMKPGGTWIGPPNGIIVHNSIHFEAKAFPTNHGDPAINRVNFTVGWGGAWRIACVVYSPPANDNIFACNVMLAQLNAPAGPIKVSFDVYDQQGNANLAPNGVHTLYYQP